MMIKFFQQMLSDIRNASNETSAVQANHHELELAASVILLETAAMDNDIADSELSEISQILKQHFRLTSEETANLLETADAVRKSAIDLYKFTQIINENCSAEQKKQLMEYIWQIIYADGRLDKHEDYLVHKLARLLHVEHKDFISAKLKARDNAGSSQT